MGAAFDIGRAARGFGLVVVIGGVLEVAAGGVDHAEIGGIDSGWTEPVVIRSCGKKEMGTNARSASAGIHDVQPFIRGSWVVFEHGLAAGRQDVFLEVAVFVVVATSPDGKGGFDAFSKQAGDEGAGVSAPGNAGHAKAVRVSQGMGFQQRKCFERGGFGSVEPTGFDGGRGGKAMGGELAVWDSCPRPF